MFASIEFWAFVALALLVYNLIDARQQNALLLAASYFVYAYFDWHFLGLLCLTTVVNFYIARRLSATNLHRRRFLQFGIVFNLGVLGIFKYANFFIGTAASFLDHLGIAANPTVMNILLPLGLSFYTFRVLSYLLDCYSKRINPIATPLVNFALYVAFFPQIASGPIERAPRFLPPLKATRRLSQQQIVDGLTYISLGLFYKIAIANAISPSVDGYFNRVADLAPADALAAMILFSVQLYADFAGYSLLATGVSTWFGLPAMDNFRQPNFARSVIEFWTRWHISLSTWFRDYLFYPLSRSLLARWGSRRALAVQVSAYFVTMLATGIWHGANWTFVIWGGLYGVYMAVETLLTRTGKRLAADAWVWRIRLATITDIFTTQLLVAVAWVFFRSSSLGNALLLFQRMLTPGLSLNGQWWLKILTPIAMLFVVDILQFKAKSVVDFWQLKLVWRAALLVFLILGIIIFGGQANAPFVYYGF